MRIQLRLTTNPNKSNLSDHSSRAWQHSKSVRKSSRKKDFKGRRENSKWLKISISRTQLRDQEGKMVQMPWITCWEIEAIRRKTDRMLRILSMGINWCDVEMVFRNVYCYFLVKLLQILYESLWYFRSNGLDEPNEAKAMKFVYLNKYFFVFRHWHILFNF